jgi:hypothetical protein
MTRITVIPAQLTSFQSFLYIIFTSILSLSLLTAQEERDLVDAFIDHTDNAREVIYLHLNKSTYIKGESVGFTAYVIG